MDRTSSSLFQKTYHRLTEPTQVTVHGEIIGTWYPKNGARPVVARALQEEPEHVLVQPFSKAQQAGRK